MVRTPNDHDEIVQFIPEYEAGTLSAADRRRVAEHLDRCEECRRFREEAVRLREDLRTLSDHECREHISSERIVRYAEEPGAVDSTERGRIEVHVLFCSECADDLRRVRAVDLELGTHGRPEDARRAEPAGFLGMVQRFLWRPAAAYAIAAVVLLMVSLDHYRSSDSDGMQIEPVFRLSEPMRGGLSMQTVERHRHAGMLRLSGFAKGDATRDFQVQFRDSAGGALYSRPLPDVPAEGREFQVAVESGVIPDGRYSLRVLGVNRDDPSDTLLTTYPFILRTTERQ